MELQGQLGGNQEQEVGLNVGHRLLDGGLLRGRPPGGGVKAEGGAYGGAALLLGQPLQEAPDLGAEDAVRTSTARPAQTRVGLLTPWSRSWC